MAQWALSNHQGISAAPLTTGCLTAHSATRCSAAAEQAAQPPWARQTHNEGPCAVGGAQLEGLRSAKNTSNRSTGCANKTVKIASSLPPVPQ